jgi:hypothetical protein
MRRRIRNDERVEFDRGIGEAFLDLLDLGIELNLRVRRAQVADAL